MIISKYSRSCGVLRIFDLLQQGEVVNRKEIAKELEVNPRTVRRYINKEIKNYLAEFCKYDTEIEVINDRKKGGDILKKDEQKTLTKKDVLVIARILLESRSVTVSELKKLLTKLISQLSTKDGKEVSRLIGNEKDHYLSVKNASPLIDKIWDLNNAIENKKIVNIEYNTGKSYDVKPQGVIFSDFYFYLIAELCKSNYDNLTVLRFDRIEDYLIKKEGFSSSYSDRFEEGEFRKRVQFMHSGELIRVKFRYFGRNTEPIEDRLPTAEVIKKEDDSYTMRAEVYGVDGFIMWALTQKKGLEILKPVELREKMKETIIEMLSNYQ